MLWIVDVDADHTGTQDWGSRKASPFLQWIAFLKGLANSWLTASQLMLKEERNQHRSCAPEMRCKNRKCGLWVPSIWECWDSREICKEGRWKVGHVSTTPTQRPSKAVSTLTEDDACSCTWPDSKGSEATSIREQRLTALPFRLFLTFLLP